MKALLDLPDWSFMCYVDFQRVSHSFRTAGIAWTPLLEAKKKILERKKADGRAGYDHEYMPRDRRAGPLVDDGAQ